MRGFKRFFAARKKPPALLTLWISGPLDFVSVSCLKSAIRFGHDVHLYSYGDIPNIPKGVSHKDARSIIPEDEIFLYDGIEQPSLFGSVGPFSDAFRYRSQILNRGVWMDTDMYFLQRIDLSPSVILAWEKPKKDALTTNWRSNLIGGALLKLPPKSALTSDLVRLTSKPYQMPPWLSQQRQKEVLDKLQGRPFFPGAVTYATVGPVALTYFARERGMLHDVLPSSHYYPLFFREIERLGERYEDFCASLPQETKTIHIWNSAFKRAFKAHTPQGSFAARLKEESLDE
ncbi:MAG: hypothetical protein ACRBBK_12665 [Paracoccaceae bacterium]